MLTCPSCDGSTLHFTYVRVRVNPDDTNENVVYDFPVGFERNARYNKAMTPGTTEERSQYRGGGVEVGYECEECGARWATRQDFHKGNIYSALEPIEGAGKATWTWDDLKVKLLEL